MAIESKPVIIHLLGSSKAQVYLDHCFDDSVGKKNVSSLML